MGVEVLESDSVITMENGSEATMAEENGKVNITFGSHGVDEPVKVEVNEASESNLPKDVVDEWPEPQQTHSFYFPRYRPIEDQNVKAKLDLADKELQKKNQARGQIIEKLKSKRTERAQVVTQIRSLSVENKQFRTILDEKRKEMEPLQQALGKLRGSSGGGRERGSGLCSSEQELNAVIKSYEYRIQHESNTLTEEKQILREIKQLEGTREKVIANAAEMAKIQESLGEKDAIHDQVKLIGVGLDGVRKEKQVIHARLKQLDEEKLAVDKVIGALEDELTAVTEKRDQIFENIRNMRKQREEGNTPFYENRNLLTKAKMIAANKDIEALKELLDTEMEKFKSQWNCEKAFRTDYERRILPSLDMRQFSRDARIRNPNEKPLVGVEAPTPSQQSEVAVKAHAKQQHPKEDIIDAAASEQKVEKTKNAKNNKEGNKKTVLHLEEIIDQEDKEEFVLSTDKSQKKDEVDEKKLKELKREEEIAKRNQAEERKKKLAEKAATKAAIKAQKEAEKKLKEREKRARKKSGAGAAVESEEPAEAVPEELAESEKIEEKIETSVPQKNKERSIRPRAAHPRGQDSLPKAIFKRKKATNYWMWAIPAAAMVTLVLVMIVYNNLS